AAEQGRGGARWVLASTPPGAGTSRRRGDRARVLAEWTDARRRRQIFVTGKQLPLTGGRVVVVVVVAVVRGLEKRRTILGSPSQNRGRRRMLLLLQGPRPPAAAPGMRPLRRGPPRPRPLRRQRRRRQVHPCPGQTARRGRKNLARITSSSSSKIDPWLAR
ncbi:unnamed protein product, partial [Ectocarpus sp. 12 AP-2014]